MDSHHFEIAHPMRESATFIGAVGAYVQELRRTLKEKTAVIYSSPLAAGDTSCKLVIKSHQSVSSIQDAVEACATQFKLESARLAGQIGGPTPARDGNSVWAMTLQPYVALWGLKVTAARPRAIVSGSTQWSDGGMNTDPVTGTLDDYGNMVILRELGTVCITPGQVCYRVK